MTTRTCDILIVGAGPAGLYGAYYAGFRGFDTVVLDTLPEAGGQITAMYPEKDIFDVGGFPVIKGRDLVNQLLEQAAAGHPEYLLDEQAVQLQTCEEGPAVVTTATGRRIEAKAVILTGGIGSFRPRPIPVGEEWIGRGAAYFVPRLAEYEGRDVVIVGGGDSAFDWAWSLHPLAKSVAIVHRREEFRAHSGMVEKVRALGVRFVTSSELAAVHGTDAIEAVDVRHKVTGEVTTMPCDAVVAALGFIANIGPMADWGLELSKRRVVVDASMHANLPRVLAAGDLATYPGKVPLIAVGFGEVATAVNNAAPLVDPHLGVFPGHSSGESGE
ncbi:MAG: ferredoxin/flavodoxin---NADP+ reductase [Actinomycetota bacterium]|nr:ferredoxin/flavodoxin---NADP+ reductase [Actinomycetota bacterium]